VKYIRRPGRTAIAYSVNIHKMWPILTDLDNFCNTLTTKFNVQRLCSLLQALWRSINVPIIIIIIIIIIINHVASKMSQFTGHI